MRLLLIIVALAGVAAVGWLALRARSSAGTPHESAGEATFDPVAPVVPAAEPGTAIVAEPPGEPAADETLDQPDPDPVTETDVDPEPEGASTGALDPDAGWEEPTSTSLDAPSEPLPPEAADHDQEPVPEGDHGPVVPDPEAPALPSDDVSENPLWDRPR